MKPNCEVIQDLLPLYADDMVSQVSKETVGAHLESCKECRETLDRFKAAAKMYAPLHRITEKQLKRMAYRKIYLPIIAILLLALTVLDGFLICGMVPVWLTYEEAIASVNPIEGRLKVTLSEKADQHVASVTSTEQGTARGIVYYGYRLDMGKASRTRDTVTFSKNMIGDAFWYRGDVLGRNNILICGDPQYLLEAATETSWITLPISRILEYFFMVTAGAGVLCLAVGILLRKKAKGIRLIHISIGFLCCAASCLFVTGGHLICVASAYNVMGFLNRFLAILTMTGLSYGTVISAITAYKVLRRNK